MQAMNEVENWTMKRTNINFKDMHGALRIGPIEISCPWSVAALDSDPSGSIVSNKKWHTESPLRSPE